MQPIAKRRSSATGAKAFSFVTQALQAQLSSALANVTFGRAQQYGRMSNVPSVPIASLASGHRGVAGAVRQGS